MRDFFDSWPFVGGAAQWVEARFVLVEARLVIGGLEEGGEEGELRDVLPPNGILEIERRRRKEGCRLVEDEEVRRVSARLAW